MSGPVEGGIAPSCGALVAPIELATGKKAYFCGKPNPLMMRTGLRLLNCHSADAVMVGDRMDTDVISGLESGMSTVLVLSGVSTQETLNTYAYRPSVVLSGVGDIVKLAHGELKIRIWTAPKLFCWNGLGAVFYPAFRLFPRSDRFPRWPWCLLW